MRKRTAKLFLFLSLMAAMGALPSAAMARQGGNDDPPGDVQQLDPPGHH